MDRQLIQEGEGYRQNVYKCSKGHPTIGYGHKLLPQELYYLKKVTKQQARQMLDKDIKKARDWVNQYFGGQVLNLMGEQRKAVLVDMAYNLGSVRWPKLTACLRKGDYERAGYQILDSDYAKQTKDRALRNSKIMKTGRFMTKEEAKGSQYSRKQQNFPQYPKQQPNLGKANYSYFDFKAQENILGDDNEYDSGNDFVDFGSKFEKRNGSDSEQSEQSERDDY